MMEHLDSGRPGADSPGAEPPQDDAATLGGILAAARAKAGLSVRQVAEELHVKPALLQALEEDRLDVFAAPVFVRGYLRHLADHLGLDYRDLARRYARQTDGQDVELAVTSPIRENGILWAPILIAALILVIGVPAFWFTWISRETLAHFISSDEPALETIAVPPAATPPQIAEETAAEPAPEETARETAEETGGRGSPAAENPAAENPSAENPSTEDPPAENPSTENPSIEDPPAEDPSAEDPSAEDPPADGPPTD